MRQFLVLILFMQSVITYSQSDQPLLSSPYKTIDLSEVVVTNETLYDIYKKAVRNLKEKLIKNTEITYKIEGKETESIKNEERSLDALFTAKLEKANPNKGKLNYKLMLSYMEHTPDVQESEIMKRSRYCALLFFDNIPTEIKQNKLNTIESNDSLIYIYDKNDEQNVINLYTICREDTTLIGVNIDYEAGKRSSRATYKTERLSGKTAVEYKKTDEGYYLSSLKQHGSRYFKFRKSGREDEEVSLNYVVEALPDIVVSASEVFKPSTYKIYKKANVGNK